MIIDAHCHVWPPAIAERVLAAKPAGLAPIGDGTLDGLRATMDDAGVDLACCLAIANEARHVDRTNEFIGRIDRSRFIPFGTVHTGLPIERNLAALRDNGIRAVKFHPNFQGMSLAAPEVIDLMAALAEQGIVVLAHIGQGDDDAASERGNPVHARALVERIPDLTLIACHYGGYHRIEAAEDVAVGSPLILETSWPPALAALGTERIRAIITRHGADRVVFGSDWPMAHPAAEIATIRSLGLSAADQDAILGGNLATLLGLATTRPSTPQSGTPRPSAPRPSAPRPSASQPGARQPGTSPVSSSRSGPTEGAFS